MGLCRYIFVFIALWSVGCKPCFAIDSVEPEWKLLAAWQKELDSMQAFNPAPERLCPLPRSIRRCLLLPYGHNSLLGLLEELQKREYTRNSEYTTVKLDLDKKSVQELESDCTNKMLRHYSCNTYLVEDDSLYLFWTTELWGSASAESLQACKITPADDSISSVKDLGLIDKRTIAFVRFYEEGPVGWKNHFSWVDNTGKVVVTAKLPEKLIAGAGLSTQSLQWHGNKGVWALQSFYANQKSYNDYPPTDITVLEVGMDKCEVIDFISREDHFLETLPECRIESNLDSAVLVPGRDDAVVYRQTLRIFAGEVHKERLFFHILWMKKINGAKRVLDLNASYSGPLYSQFYWETDDSGKFVESKSRNSDVYNYYMQLVPFLRDYTSVVYLKNDMVCSLEVPE